ncbi:MAG: NRDE family protein [Ignavibacteriaceae bacterium]
MCLIVFAYKSHPKDKFIFAANRDEFYDRPTEQADYWKDHPELLAGKDLQAGGTWMGITKQGRFAAVTNYRDLKNIKEDAPSRGMLTLDFLNDNISAEEYYDNIKPSLQDYNGFNLILGSVDELFYFSTHKNGIKKLEPGIYGLSNATLNTDWPKVKKSKDVLSILLKNDEIHPWELLSILNDTRQAKDEDLPDTGVGMEWEKILSSIFIQSPKYGTRCSTAVVVDIENNFRFAEKTFFGNQGAFSNKDYSFKIKV